MRPRVFHAVGQTASPRAVVLVTIEGPEVRASLICGRPSERLRLEPLVELVKAVIDTAIEHGMAGCA